jgi:formamidopyrimidine-DNA glycosylase
VNPFFLRSVEPSLESVRGAKCVAVRRLGKRIVIDLSGTYLVIHLMIAGRLHWNGKRKPLARFVFDTGTLSLTEAGSKRRASLYVARELKEHDRGGMEVLEASLKEFSERIRRENHTVKRALADPTLFSGIGNAYSDEILHRARMSPMLLTQKMSDEQVKRLYTATRASLLEWTDRLRKEAGEGFPEKVTAFRPEMAVHGKYGQPCPVCGTPVQRIRYADNETNYCARCQTDGKLLRDRALSRLLHDDWPKSIDELL